MRDKFKVYLASGNQKGTTEEIRANLERILEAHPRISLYSPFRDGGDLREMEEVEHMNPTQIRNVIFNDNVENILSSDLVVANIYSGEFFNDTGTMYEIGYAVANHIPVIGFSTELVNIPERFNGTIDGFHSVVIGYDLLNELLNSKSFWKIINPEKAEALSKVLFVGAGNTEVDDSIASLIINNNYNVRCLDGSHKGVYSKIDEIFEDVEFMVAVIDDRKTIVSWMLGQAYARNIPIITFTNYNYDVNVMLLCSLLTHVKGLDKLDEVLKLINTKGLSSVPKYDISQVGSM